MLCKRPKACTSQPLKPTRATAPAPQQEMPAPQLRRPHAPSESSLCSPQLEKTCAQQRRPSAAKNK